MPGGLIQLAAYGSQDFYLTGNPQISFFKTVYRRYTNFSMEYYRINPEGNLGLSENDITNYRFQIKRSGDLVSDMFMVFTLPSIYSGDGTDFQWIKNIGFNIINKVRVYIGGSLIDENYGEWFDIWNELTLPESKKKEFNEMIANTEEFYDPAAYSGSGYYPRRTIGDSKIPSIKQKVVRVPLIFWFNRNYSLALPLVALQYHPVEIDIEIRKISDLYTVIDIDTSSKKYGCRIKPESNINNYNRLFSLVNFVNDESLLAGVGDDTTLKNFTIDIHLEVNYIFLDNDEMKSFAKSEHRYLIQQVKKSTFQGSVGSDTLELLVHHPTSFMVIVGKRSDIVDRNDWNNYTNWIYNDIPPWSENFNNPYYEEFYNEDIAKEKINETNFEFKKSPNIFKDLQLKLNATDRFSAQEQEFFESITTFKYAKRMPRKGILMYSFAVNPLDYQPSGSCNFSRFNNIQLAINTQDIPQPTSLRDYMYKYDINVYTVNYNILRITSGSGNLEFSN
tara:strand:+ start:823 stop:2337 length:1515 start_codon:yes stop_codon:yes gene_type:complete